MSIYKKLSEARMKLQNTKLTKSGHNKFAGYQYFELGDFMPAINAIFADIGLCGVVSYGKDIATLTISDVDSDGVITITSPMAEANLKGCHPIQNLGAVETYTRRYLWVTAMEIVEHDALDSSPPLEGGNFKDIHAKPSTKITPTTGLWEALGDEEQQFLQGIADQAIGLINLGDVKEAVKYIAEQKLDPDEKAALVTRFDSKQRSAMTKANAAIKEEGKNVQ